MRLFGIAVALVVLSALAGTASATIIYTPITVTGFNVDEVVAKADANFASGASSYNFGGWAYYEYGRNTGAPTTGLNPGTFTSLTGDHQFTLASFAGSNALAIGPGYNSGTLTLAPAEYSALSILAASGGGYRIINYTVNYAGGTTATGSFNVDDWCGHRSGAPVPTVALNSGARISSGDGYQAQTASLFQFDITGLDTSKNINSISFTAGGTDWIGDGAIFAVSGTPAPEPATMSLLAIGGLAALRRRRA